MKKYSEKLKDPRWQKKRLEILERDKFTCQACNSKDNTLNVHHKAYKKDKNPWDYAKKDLITFCEICHNKLRNSLSEKESILLKICDCGNLKKFYCCPFMTKIPMQTPEGHLIHRGCLSPEKCKHLTTVLYYED